MRVRVVYGGGGVCGGEECSGFVLWCACAGKSVPEQHHKAIVQSLFRALSHLAALALETSNPLLPPFTTHGYRDNNIRQ